MEWKKERKGIGNFIGILLELRKLIVVFGFH